MRHPMPSMPPLSGLVKSSEVEDPVNRYLHRPLAYLFARLVFPTPITPNMITFSTVILGFLAGCAFIYGTQAAMVAGGVSLWAAAILDGADGILARAKKQQSEFGRALDGAADALVAVFTVFPAFYHIWVTHRDPYHLFLMVPALGLTIVHLATYDFYKESFMMATRPGSGGEGNDADHIEATVRAAETKGPIVRMAMRYALIPHLRRQKWIVNLLDPEAWHLSQLLRAGVDADTYKSENLWPMRIWALISLAPHSYLMAICAMFNHLEVYLYIRVFAMNALFAAAIAWQRYATSRSLRRVRGREAMAVGLAE
jgi:hypothetical protein